MRVVLGQLETAWEDKVANRQQLATWLEHASLEVGTLVVLPEMYETGFSFHASEIAEKYTGDSFSFLQNLAKQYQIYLVAGLAEQDAQTTPRNVAVAFNPNGELLGRYIKLHPFSMSREQTYYAAGDQLTAVKLGPFSTGLAICYDLRFPELFRQSAKRGVQMMIVMANWPTQRVGHWEALLRARAIENQAYVLGVNRCGIDPNWHYPGRSMVVGPMGEVIAQAGNSACWLEAELDLAKVVDYRQKFPALADMRDDLLP